MGAELVSAFWLVAKAAGPFLLLALVVRLVKRAVEFRHKLR